MPSKLSERKKKIEKTIGSQLYKKLSEKQKDLMAKTAGVVEIPMPSKLQEQIREILYEFSYAVDSDHGDRTLNDGLGEYGAKLLALFSQTLSSLQKEIDGVKIKYTKDERAVAKAIGILPQVIEHETWFNQGVDAVIKHLAKKVEEYEQK